MIVVKIGGSVATKAKSILSELFEVAKLTNKKIIVIPGGWIFADIVRLLDYNVNLSESKSNAMAILAMEMYAYYLSSFGYELASFNELPLKQNPPKLQILKPYSILKEIEEELPKSWEVTSDSIAIWIAAKIGAKEVIKVTDVDGLFTNNKLVRHIDAKKLESESCLDCYAPKLIKKYGIKLFICNGKVEGRVKKYILKEESVGTLIS